MTAVGAYLRGLREGQHISRTGLADELDVDPTTLWRIEDGKQEPGGTLLITLVRRLGGSFDDVGSLVGQKDGAEQGLELAQMRLNQEVTRTVDSFASDELDRVRQELADDPEFLDTIARRILRRQRR